MVHIHTCHTCGGKRGGKRYKSGKEPLALAQKVGAFQVQELVAFQKLVVVIVNVQKVIAVIVPVGSVGVQKKIVAAIEQGLVVVVI